MSDVVDPALENHQRERSIATGDEYITIGEEIYYIVDEWALPLGDAQSGDVRTQEGQTSRGHLFMNDQKYYVIDHVGEDCGTMMFQLEDLRGRLDRTRHQKLVSRTPSCPSVRGPDAIKLDKTAGDAGSKQRKKTVIVRMEKQEEEDESTEEEEHQEDGTKVGDEHASGTPARLDAHLFVVSPESSRTPTPRTISTFSEGTDTELKEDTGSTETDQDDTPSPVLCNEVTVIESSESDGYHPALTPPTVSISQAEDEQERNDAYIVNTEVSNCQMLLRDLFTAIRVSYR